ncbi:flagellar biosynthetic protein FliR [Photobacterium damselae]|uniref:flagellar biosynthetic protein FliR n=1 Tax=Photobacterium damselae TaxID=38293 RepID=UPI001F184440|nr:flagellar biosynthetic protein FliR [Photobacterium damselae]UKA04631.1 flagellar biosynthetic protein FliR [Photobacterium damselae subsp. damselae]
MVVLASLVFARITVFMTLLPIIQKRVPVKALVVLSVLISYLIAGRLSNVVHIDTNTFTLMHFLFEMVKNSFIGFVFGASVLFSFEIVAFVGQALGVASQLSMASMFDPVNGTNNSSVTTAITIMFSLYFIDAGGFLVILDFFGRSFQSFGVIGSNIDSINLKAFILQFSNVISAGIAVGVPFLLASLMLNGAMAVLSRMASSFNTFSVGIPVVIVVFITALGYFIPDILMQINVVMLSTMDGFLDSMLTTLG